MLNHTSKWMSQILVFAGIYNLIWGASVILFPNLFFEISGMPLPLYPMIWQCVGMVVGVYGVGYLAASRNPLIHWPIILVGLLGKVFGPIGFAFYLAEGAFPLTFGMIIIFNDLIWWIPFFLILRRAMQVNPELKKLRSN